MSKHNFLGTFNYSLFQGRLFSYNDTHRHRLGANFNQIPVNCPYRYLQALHSSLLFTDLSFSFFLSFCVFSIIKDNISSMLFCFRSKIRNYERDGPMTIDGNQEGAPNYYPNSFSGPQDHKSYLESSFKVI